MDEHPGSPPPSGHGPDPASDGPPPPPAAGGDASDAPDRSRPAPDGAGEPEDGPDGPPPPPFVRERAARRRRRIVIGVIAAVLLVAASVGAVLTAMLTGPADDPVAGPDAPLDDEEAPTEEAPLDEDPADEDPADPDDAEPAPDPPPRAMDDPIELDDQGRPDREVPAEERITPPALATADPAATRIAELFLDIDASERAMLGFQLDARASLGGGTGLDDLDAILDEVQAAAARGNDALDVLRGRLEVSQDDPRAEAVRASYVIHLDSWVRYLVAIEDEPSVLLGDTSRYTVDINRTADAFVRAVEELTTTVDLDDDLERYIEEIVQRGFPAPEESQV